VLVKRIGDDQHGLQTHVLKLGSGQLGLGCVEREGVNNSDAVFAGQLRKDRADTGAIHLLVDLVREVLFGRARESAATPTPQRRGSHTGTCAAGALLAPRLASGVLDRAT